MSVVDDQIENAIQWARKESPWILHVNSGSCNGCDIEFLDTLMPGYDAERFGIKQVDTPKHADVMLVTGPVTRQMEERLERSYEQMPEPKRVIAAGTCSINGGVFKGHYNCKDGVDQVVPVDLYVPGCPITPEAVIASVKQLMEGEE